MIDPDVSIKVSDINRYVKQTLENDENLRYLYVRGEISNWKVASNGAAYFTLGDSESMISCVMFSNYRSALKFAPKNGDEVKILSSLSVYTPRGTYSLRVYNILKQGLGDALLALEELKKKLASEGLFDPSRKRKINIYPKAVGVITAANSAAIKDIVFNIQRRYPIADIFVFPSAVQGDNAPKELLEAFKKSQEYDLDTLIIGRGGGSSEDLSAFNDETLVRAVATSKCPVISAVGHEIDTTLIDLIADKRASTPTGAAELATVDKREIEERLMNIDLSIKETIRQQLVNYETKFQYLINHLDRSIINYIDLLQKTLDVKKKRVDDLNPLNVLKRGYSLTSGKDGKIITSVKNIKENDEIKTILSDGEVISEIRKVAKTNGRKEN